MSTLIEEGHELFDISCDHGSRFQWWPGMDGTGAWMNVVRAPNCSCEDPPRPYPIVRCRDEAHRPDRFANGAHWCPHSTKLDFTDPEAIGYLDGRCCGLVYRCEQTGKVVVHNKRCDSIYVLARADRCRPRVKT